jgi:hypothetical protein
MTHDDLLNIYFPKTDLHVPQYVTPAPPMPQQQPMPEFINQPVAPPQSAGGHASGGGYGLSGGDLVKMAIPMLAQLFLL